MAKNTGKTILGIGAGIGAVALIGVFAPWLFFLLIPTIICAAAVAKQNKEQRGLANNIYGSTIQYQNYLSRFNQNFPSKMPQLLYNANIEKQNAYEKNIENNLSQYLDQCRNNNEKTFKFKDLKKYAPEAEQKYLTHIFSNGLLEKLDTIPLLKQIRNDDDKEKLLNEQQLKILLNGNSIEKYNALVSIANNKEGVETALKTASEYLKEYNDEKKTDLFKALQESDENSKKLINDLKGKLGVDKNDKSLDDYQKCTKEEMEKKIEELINSVNGAKDNTEYNKLSVIKKQLLDQIEQGNNIKQQIQQLNKENELLTKANGKGPIGQEMSEEEKLEQQLATVNGINVNDIKNLITDDNIDQNKKKELEEKIKKLEDDINTAKEQIEKKKQNLAKDPNGAEKNDNNPSNNVNNNTPNDQPEIDVDDLKKQSEGLKQEIGEVIAAEEKKKKEEEEKKKKEEEEQKKKQAEEEKKKKEEEEQKKKKEEEEKKKKEEEEQKQKQAEEEKNKKIEENKQKVKDLKEKNNQKIIDIENYLKNLEEKQKQLEGKTLNNLQNDLTPDEQNKLNEEKTNLENDKNALLDEINQQKQQLNQQKQEIEAQNQSLPTDDKINENTNFDFPEIEIKPQNIDTNHIIQNMDTFNAKVNNLKQLNQKLNEIENIDTNNINQDINEDIKQKKSEFDKAKQEAIDKINKQKADIIANNSGQNNGNDLTGNNVQDNEQGNVSDANKLVQELKDKAEQLNQDAKVAEEQKKQEEEKQKQEQEEKKKKAEENFNKLDDLDKTLSQTNTTDMPADGIDENQKKQIEDKKQLLEKEKNYLLAKINTAKNRLTQPNPDNITDGEINNLTTQTTEITQKIDNFNQMINNIQKLIDKKQEIEKTTLDFGNLDDGVKNNAIEKLEETKKKFIDQINTLINNENNNSQDNGNNLNENGNDKGNENGNNIDDIMDKFKKEQEEIVNQAQNADKEKKQQKEEQKKKEEEEKKQKKEELNNKIQEIQNIPPIDNLPDNIDPKKKEEINRKIEEFNKKKEDIAQKIKTEIDNIDSPSNNNNNPNQENYDEMISKLKEELDDINKNIQTAKEEAQKQEIEQAINQRLEDNNKKNEEIDKTIKKLQQKLKLFEEEVPNKGNNNYDKDETTIIPGSNKNNDNSTIEHDDTGTHHKKLNESEIVDEGEIDSDFSKINEQNNISEHNDNSHSLDTLDTEQALENSNDDLEKLLENDDDISKDIPQTKIIATTAEDQKQADIIKQQINDKIAELSAKKTEIEKQNNDLSNFKKNIKPEITIPAEIEVNTDISSVNDGMQDLQNNINKHIKEAEEKQKEEEKQKKIAEQQELISFYQNQLKVLEEQNKQLKEDKTKDTKELFSLTIEDEDKQYLDEKEQKELEEINKKKDEILKNMFNGNDNLIAENDKKQKEIKEELDKIQKMKIDFDTKLPEKKEIKINSQFETSKPNDKEVNEINSKMLDFKTKIGTQKLQAEKKKQEEEEKKKQEEIQNLKNKVILLQKVLGDSSPIPDNINALNDYYSKLVENFKSKAVDTAVKAVATATNFEEKTITQTHQDWIKQFKKLKTEQQIDFFAYCIEADKGQGNSMTSNKMLEKMQEFKAGKYSQKNINKAIAKIIKKNHHQAEINTTKILSDKTKVNNFLNNKDYGKTMKNAFSNYNKKSTMYLPNINISTSKGFINPNNNYKKAGNFKPKKSEISI